MTDDIFMAEEPSPRSRQWEIDALERALRDMRSGGDTTAETVNESARAVADVAPSAESSSGISLGDLLDQIDHVRDDVQDLPNRPTNPAPEPTGVPVTAFAAPPVADLEEGDASSVPTSGEQNVAPAVSVLFQAPAPVAPRRASRPVSSPVADEDDEPVVEPAHPIEGEEPSGTAEQDDVLEQDAADNDAEDDGDGRRRRRRRGGRGRKRRPTDEDAETAGDEDTTEDAEEPEPESSAPDDEDAADDDSGSSRRRRRRRRRGAGDEDGSDEPARSRSSRRGRDEIVGVKGSTRLEAKRQRRREGRESARRRPIISEAEFLARRESVERTMLVREHEGRTQLVVLEDGVLVEHYVARKAAASLIGNVYVGKVQNVLPSMEAAFVDIGRGRNAVLYAGEVNWDAAGIDGSQRRIELALKAGDPVLVQVSKDPVGHKGARLTSQISLPGRYLVYVPGASMTGISRKLPDVERSRLKAILREVVPADGGVIVRTAAEGASEEELRRDVERLVAQWESIQKRSGAVNAPASLHNEPNLITKVVRDVFNEDFGRLVVSGQEPWDTVHGYVEKVAPDLLERVERWDVERADGDVAPSRKDDIFTVYRVDEQLAKALDRKVWLPSGGSLVIDRTEAMTVIDVNTGRFVGSGGNLEETVTKNNLEAAEEIVRQLRLRDVGGIVVIDFIDMVLDSNRDLVLRRLVECLGRDRTKHQVAEVTSLGLVQMTRKRVGQGLLEAFSEPCEHCSGSGVILFEEPIVNPQQVSSPDSGSSSRRGTHAGSSKSEERAAKQAEKLAKEAEKEAEQHRRAAAEAARMAEAARKAKERAEQDEAEAETVQTPAPVATDEPAAAAAAPAQAEAVQEEQPATAVTRPRRRRRATAPATTPGAAADPSTPPV